MGLLLYSRGHLAYLAVRLCAKYYNQVWSLVSQTVRLAEVSAALCIAIKRDYCEIHNNGYTRKPAHVTGTWAPRLRGVPAAEVAHHTSLGLLLFASDLLSQ